MSDITASTPRWRVTGGSLIIAYAVLELANYLVQLVMDTQTSNTGLFAISVVLSIVSGVLIVVASFFLALGTTGTNGIVGKSLIGRIALILFGISVFVYQLVGLGYYFLNDRFFDEVSTTLLVLQIIGFVTALVAAIYIFIENVAHHTARWSLFVAIGFGLLYAVINVGPDWLQVVLAILAILARLHVGITYLFNGEPKAEDIL